MPSTKMNIREKLEDTTLDLSMMQLEEVPVKEIAQIKKGTTLDLSNNSLKSLGKNFAPSLKHLVKLDLSKNLLTELPDNIGELVSLRHLDLYSNQITHLPLSFGNMKALRWLDLKNNPLIPKVAEVAGPCLDAQQCQQCARKVVSFLQSMQVVVEEERKRRLEEKRSQQEQVELQKKEQQRQQNSSSKNSKKKKGTKSAGNTQTQTKAENGTGNRTASATANSKKIQPVELEKKPPAAKTSKGYIVFYVLMRVLRAFVIGLLLAFGFLYLVNRERFMEIKGEAARAWNSTLAIMPVQVVDIINSVQPSMVAAWDYIKHAYVQISSHPSVVPVLESAQQHILVAWNSTKDVYLQVSSSTVVQHGIESFLTAWDAFCAVIANLGRTLYQQVPIYFETVKNTIF